jgi:hypothetical protein
LIVRLLRYFSQQSSNQAIKQSSFCCEGSLPEKGKTVKKSG